MIPTLNRFPTTQPSFQITPSLFFGTGEERKAGLEWHQDKNEWLLYGPDNQNGQYEEAIIKPNVLANKFVLLFQQLGDVARTVIADFSDNGKAIEAVYEMTMDESINSGNPAEVVITKLASTTNDEVTAEINVIETQNGVPGNPPETINEIAKGTSEDHPKLKEQLTYTNVPPNKATKEPAVSSRFTYSKGEQEISYATHSSSLFNDIVATVPESDTSFEPGVGLLSGMLPTGLQEIDIADSQVKTITGGKVEKHTINIPIVLHN